MYLKIDQKLVRIQRKQISGSETGFFILLKNSHFSLLLELNAPNIGKSGICLKTGWWDEILSLGFDEEKSQAAYYRENFLA